MKIFARSQLPTDTWGNLCLLLVGMIIVCRSWKDYWHHQEEQEEQRQEQRQQQGESDVESACRRTADNEDVERKEGEEEVSCYNHPIKQFPLLSALLGLSTFGLALSSMFGHGTKFLHVAETMYIIASYAIIMSFLGMAFYRHVHYRYGYYHLEDPSSSFKKKKEIFYAQAFVILLVLFGDTVLSLCDIGWKFFQTSNSMYLLGPLITLIAVLTLLNIRTNLNGYNMPLFGVIVALLGIAVIGQFIQYELKRMTFLQSDTFSLVSEAAIIISLYWFYRKEKQPNEAEEDDNDDEDDNEVAVVEVDDAATIPTKNHKLVELDEQIDDDDYPAIIEPPAEPTTRKVAPDEKEAPIIQNGMDDAITQKADELDNKDDDDDVESCCTENA